MTRSRRTHGGRRHDAPARLVLLTTLGFLAAACGSPSISVTVPPASLAATATAGAPESARTSSLIPSPTATLSPSPSRTGLAAVGVELDRQGTLMTSTSYPVAITPDLLRGLWNVAGASIPMLVGTIKKFSKPHLDAAGRTTTLAKVGFGDSDLTCILNGDGTISAVAIKTPTGGEGGTSLYLTVDLVYGNLVRALGGDDSSVLAGLRIGAQNDVDTDRLGVDRSLSLARYRYRLIGTATGDWFIVTPADP